MAITEKLDLEARLKEELQITKVLLNIVTVLQCRYCTSSFVKCIAVIEIDMEFATSLKQYEAQQLSQARVGTEEQMQRLKFAEEELAQVCSAEFLFYQQVPFAF